MKPNLVFSGVYVLVGGGVITLLSIFAGLSGAAFLAGVAILALGVLIAIAGTWL